MKRKTIPFLACFILSACASVSKVQYQVPPHLARFSCSNVQFRVPVHPPVRDFELCAFQQSKHAHACGYNPYEEGCFEQSVLFNLAFKDFQRAAKMTTTQWQRLVIQSVAINSLIALDEGRDGWAIWLMHHGVCHVMWEPQELPSESSVSKELAPDYDFYEDSYE